MGTRDLLKKFKAHETYCDKNYSGDIRQGKKQSLIHFAWWLETVWLPQDDIRRKRITESKKRSKNA